MTGFAMGAHRPWSAEDTERLRVHIERGGSTARAAVVFKRTRQAVKAHASACGWKFPTIRQLRKKAMGSERYVPPEL
jgi:hypothetical protein